MKIFAIRNKRDHDVYLGYSSAGAPLLGIFPQCMRTVVDAKLCVNKCAQVDNDWDIVEADADFRLVGTAPAVVQCCNCGHPQPPR